VVNAVLQASMYSNDVTKQVAQLSQRDCAAGSVVAKSGRRYSADNIGLSSTTVT